MDATMMVTFAFRSIYFTFGLFLLLLYGSFVVCKGLFTCFILFRFWV
jgi:hypothetical protein